MNRITLFIICICTVVAFAEKKPVKKPVRSLNGTWCTGEDDGMLLTFSGTDTLTITSASDESMGGSGTYLHTDSTFSATLKNGDLVLSMKYRYRWKGNDTILAKATMFTIDDESVDFPEEWMSMGRCEKK
ncbi:MAG: hypothetical protein JW863_05235 [Chitinispirillaceae bacterium]|nr:hypothetical protein [Chitinispirillaceae bacterium]